MGRLRKYIPEKEGSEGAPVVRYRLDPDVRNKIRDEGGRAYIERIVRQDIAAGKSAKAPPSTPAPAVSYVPTMADLDEVFAGFEL